MSDDTNTQTTTEEPEVGLDNLNDKDFWDFDGSSEDLFGETEEEGAASADQEIPYEADPEKFFSTTPEDQEEKEEKDTSEEAEDTSDTSESTEEASEETETSETTDTTDGETEEAEGSEGGEEGETETLKEFFGVKAKLMVDNGIFSTLSEEDLEGVEDEESYLALQSKELDNRLDGIMEDWSAKIGTTGKAFMKFTMEGGTPFEFLRNYNEPDFSKMSVATDKDQARILRNYYLHVEKKDEKDTEELIEFYGDKDKLKEKAEELKERAIELKDKRDADLVESQKQANLRRVAKNKDFKTKVVDTLKDDKALEGISITAKDKKDLVPFITKASVKLDNGNYITPLQSKLREVLGNTENPAKILKLAKILKDDFELEGLAVKAETKATKKAKKSLETLALQTTKPLTARKDAPVKEQKLSDFF